MFNLKKKEKEAELQEVVVFHDTRLVGGKDYEFISGYSMFAQYIDYTNSIISESGVDPDQNFVDHREIVLNNAFELRAKDVLDDALERAIKDHKYLKSTAIPPILPEVLKCRNYFKVASGSMLCDMTALLALQVSTLVPDAVRMEAAMSVMYDEDASTKNIERKIEKRLSEEGPALLYNNAYESLLNALELLKEEANTIYA